VATPDMRRVPAVWSRLRHLRAGTAYL